MAKRMSEICRQRMIEIVKATGQEVIDRAEELVGTGEYMTDFDIYLAFPMDGVPTITSRREYASIEAVNVINGERRASV